MPYISNVINQIFAPACHKTRCFLPFGNFFDRLETFFGEAVTLRYFSTQ
jgi:hypothetical protein